MTPLNHVLSILRAETERDKQISIGASNMSNGCTYCLARDMIGDPQPQSIYYLGARIGTAIHEYLEANNPTPDTVLGEQKVIVGEIPGYGPVKSTTDAFFTESGICADWKTTTRDKLKIIKMAVHEEPNEYETTKVVEARAKVMSYQRQVWLYGRGLENAGHTVRGCAIVFICRDGLTDNDVWEFQFPYSREQADAALDRSTKIWKYLSEGGDVEALKSSATCWPCSVNGR